MRGVLQHEEQGQRADNSVSERVGIRIVNKDMLPNHRLNSTEKETLSSSFVPLF